MERPKTAICYRVVLLASKKWKKLLFTSIHFKYISIWRILASEHLSATTIDIKLKAQKQKTNRKKKQKKGTKKNKQRKFAKYLHTIFQEALLTLLRNVVFYIFLCFSFLFEGIFSKAFAPPHSVSVLLPPTSSFYCFADITPLTALTCYIIFEVIFM